MSVRAAVIRPVRMVVPLSASKIAAAKSHIGGALDKGAPLIPRAARSADPKVLRCARDTLNFLRANRSRSARMQTSGRTAGSTRGWMGAHAPIATVLPRSETSGGIDGFIPTAALAEIGRA